MSLVVVVLLITMMPMLIGGHGLFMMEVSLTEVLMVYIENERGDDV